jgi:hypothetical protein
MPIEEYLREAFRALGPKPDDERATQAEKKRFSEQLSESLAYVFAKELRDRGMLEARPYISEVVESSGAERRMEGGIGAKKVDVTWATPEAGLIVALSIKTINWRDRRTGNYQKNLTNRRGDLLFESVTLHRRFPYAVLIGLLCLDQGAASDDTPLRRSTFLNAHERMRLFTGRDDPAGRDEQFERLYVVLHDPTPSSRHITAYEAGIPDAPVPWGAMFDEVVRLVAVRNPDSYEEDAGRIRSV